MEASQWRDYYLQNWYLRHLGGNYTISNVNCKVVLISSTCSVILSLPLSHLRGGFAKMKQAENTIFFWREYPVNNFRIYLVIHFNNLVTMVLSKISTCPSRHVTDERTRVRLLAKYLNLIYFTKFLSCLSVIIWQKFLHLPHWRSCQCQTQGQGHLMSRLKLWNSMFGRFTCFCDLCCVDDTSLTHKHSCLFIFMNS